MKNVTHHVQFSDKDEEKVRAKAEKAGLPITAYIRLSALKSRVQGAPPPIDLSPVLAHTETLDEILTRVRAITNTPNKDRLLYEADLELIERLLTELARSETELVAKIGR